MTWSIAYCLNGANVTSSSTSAANAAAGLVAHAVGSVNLQCVYCGNTGIIKGANTVGGIIGRTDHGSTQTVADHFIQNCYNTGTLECTSGSEEIIGGIVAEFRYPAYMVNPMYDSDYVQTLAVTDENILTYLQTNYPSYDFSKITYIPETLAKEITPKVNAACGANSHKKVIKLNGNSAYVDAFANWSCLYDSIVRIDSCYDYSTRTLAKASPTYNNGIVGWAGGTEQSISSVTNSMAFCNTDSSHSYTKVAHSNVTTAASSSMAADAATVTNKISAIKTAIDNYETAVSGAGTQADPFLIATPADLKWVVSQSYTYYAELANDIDMNGVEHKNAVWSSSSNLDGIKDNGNNGNSKMQTATIVSDHEKIYRASANYLRLIAEYCGQEDVYLFRNLVNERTTEQIQMILDGKESKIPKKEQIVYLGGAKDDVFELYFAPFGGDAVVWDEVNNPYCKYLRKMYNSDDYILFTWNNANYNNNFALGRQIEDMFVSAFHKNANSRNKIYLNLENFDGSSFDDLVQGKTIGYKSFNHKDFGNIHSKDMQISYQWNSNAY